MAERFLSEQQQSVIASLEKMAAMPYVPFGRPADFDRFVKLIEVARDIQDGLQDPQSSEKALVEAV